MSTTKQLCLMLPQLKTEGLRRKKLENGDRYKFAPENWRLGVSWAFAVSFSEG